MKLEFRKMTPEFAKKIANWDYEEPYSMYGFRNADITYLSDEKNKFYAILSEGKLIGFRSFGSDGQVSGGNYEESYLDTGGGLKPDLTGKGFGEEIILKGLEFGKKEFGTSRFRVTIASFNKRARKVCERLNFLEKERFLRESDGLEFIVYTKNLERGEPVAGGDAALPCAENE